MKAVIATCANHSRSLAFQASTSFLPAAPIQSPLSCSCPIAAAAKFEATNACSPRSASRQCRAPIKRRRYDRYGSLCHGISNFWQIASIVKCLVGCAALSRISLTAWAAVLRNGTEPSSVQLSSAQRVKSISTTWPLSLSPSAKNVAASSLLHSVVMHRE